jgi:effector-binding domain-containing protein
VKKIGWMLLAGALVTLVWYIFIRSYEYEVNFKTETLPGDIIQTIRIWDKSRADIQVVSVDSVFAVTQKMQCGSRNYIYQWNLHQVNDSLTKVTIRITEPSASIRNKVLIPFTNQPVERDARDVVQEFYGILKTHLEITRVEVVGEIETTPVFCVCRSIETLQTEKARGMMRNYGLLTSFISNFNLQPDGPPILKITQWSHTKGKVKFDFCFPIARQDFLPASDSLSYQQFGKEKALKAIYYGNYITSDRAWYALLEFAERNGYQTGLPIEQFYNNPNLGSNEIEWRAEVYLPIRQ